MWFRMCTKEYNETKRPLKVIKRGGVKCPDEKFTYSSLGWIGGMWFQLALLFSAAYTIYKIFD